MTRLLTVFTALAATGALLAGCGSGSSGSGTSSSGGGGGYGGSAPAKTATAPAAPADTTTTAASSSGSGGGGNIAIAADESNGLAFDKKTLSAKAGKVTITMDNPSGDSLPHAVAIEGNGVSQNGTVVQPGGKSTVTADLKPGKYTFFCPVSGHRQAGMEGTLTVS
jgi:uncharacterized cupredoxin-like copper-binding protein